jgi:hypothetical protein
MFYADYHLALAIVEERLQKAERERQLRAAPPSSFNLVRAFQARFTRQPSQKRGQYGLQ